MTPRGRRVATGALLGLAWASGFRAYMAELAGPASHIDWAGTFGAVLFPAGLVGAAFGLSEDLRRTGAGRQRSWLAAAPALLALAPLLLPGAVPALLATGQGTAALGVVLSGIFGGYAVSGRGRRTGRAVAGALAALLTAGMVATVPAVGGELLALTSPRGAWVATLAVTFMATLALACSIPFRLDDRTGTATAPDA